MAELAKKGKFEMLKGFAGISKLTYKHRLEQSLFQTAKGKSDHHHHQRQCA